MLRQRNFSSRLFCLVTGLASLVMMHASVAGAFSLTVGFADNPNSFVTMSSDDGGLGCGLPGGLGELTCIGAGLNNGGWSLDNWNIFTDPDPQISNNFSVTNNTASTQSFVVGVSLPTSISFGPPSLIRGSVQGGATDNNANGVTLSSTGVFSMYDALIDGATVRTLLDAPQSYSTAFAFDSVSTGTHKFGIPVQESVAVATISTIGLTIRFDLSAGDSATFSSVFDVQPVPEPGTAILMGLGLGAMALRRTRTH